MARPRIKPPTQPKPLDVPNDVAIAKANAAVASQLVESATTNDGGNAGANQNGTDGRPQETKTKEERHEQRMAWFYSEASRQAVNRAMRAKCEAFYDSEQYEHADIATLEERGQKAVVHNEVKPTIDFLIGTERRSRVDFYVVAEDDDPQADDDAIAKTKAIKYLEDVNNGVFERSDVADDKFKSGLGILEVGLRGDKTGVPIFIGHVPWREFLHDSRAKRDQSDARYNFRIKLVDLDVAIALLPDHEDALRAAIIQGDALSNFTGNIAAAGMLAGLDAFDTPTDGDGSRFNVATTIDLYNARERVMLIECWSREPQRRPLDEAGLGDPITFKVRVSIMTEQETLIEAWSPFKHERFPFVLDWAYRNKRTGMPYSPIFPLMGPQEALNHRMSRALFEASFNQHEMEAGAIDGEIMDVDDLRNELNDPNGIAVYANGALSGNKVRKVQSTGQVDAQLKMALFNRDSIRAMSNVNEENRGLSSQATSRVAMDAKAERGSVGTAELFDESLRARQAEGEMVLSLIEQFMTGPITIRNSAEQGGGRFERTKLNQPQPDGTILNDMAARRAHFVIGEQAWKQSYAEAAFASLMDVLTQLASSTPQIVVALLDVVFDMHPNLPRKKAVLERIRAVNGQADPDGKLTPEQQQAQAEKAQQAKAQFELQMAQLQADIRKANASGLSLETKAMADKVTALYESAQTAMVLGQAPGITPIADQILASAGFIDESGTPDTITGGAAPIDGHVPTAPLQTEAGYRPAPALMQADGAQQGIETARPDGAQPAAGPEVPPQQGAMQ